MRTRIKITDLTEPQWHFIQKFVGTEYPLDGTAVRVCYEFAPTVEFNTVVPFSKFVEIGEHLARLDKYGYPFIDPDQQDDWERENPSREYAKECLATIKEIIAIVNEMRAEMKEATGRAA